MKISELTALLEARKHDCGDLDVTQMQQTGPDSFQIVELTGAIVAKDDDNSTYILLE